PYVARTAILERADSPLTTTSTASQRSPRRLGSLFGYVTLLDAPSNDGVLVRLQGTPLVTVTDEAGIYRFLNVEQGAYRVTFEKPGFQSAAIDVVVIGGQETKADSVLMEREPGSAERPATMPITKAELTGDRMILGRVRLLDEAGKELADYQRITLALDNSDYIVTPDDAGRFEFTRLGAGLYTVLASVDGASPRSYLADLRDKRVAELKIDVAIIPEKPTPGVVVGKVSLVADGEAQPPDASGVQVALAGTRNLVASAPDGSFKIDQVPPGTYVLTATREGYEPARVDGVEVAPGQTVDVGTIQLEPKRDYPRVVWTDPPDGARNIIVGYELVVKIKFSKPMDAASVEKAIVLEPAPKYAFHMGASSHPAADDRTAVLVFSNDDDARPIKFNTQYQITVTRSAADQTGLKMKDDYTFSFVTGAPGIIKTYPRDGAVDARVNGLSLPISVFFNTRIRTETLNVNSLRIRPRPDVEPRIYFDSDPRTGWTVARIFANLEGGKEYYVTVDRSVRTSTNQPLANTPYTFRFRTQKIERELTAPREIR
ncbi:MAG: carboxypeptidase regulatory-like domain-containing protein, partial [Candidatus Sumerlaeaceae bacterium]|nr:carboxypeptidase regulatory-like domain-containing protein [Candidatus Sumerlaeaceae bacterium]